LESDSSFSASYLLLCLCCSLYICIHTEQVVYAVERPYTEQDINIGYVGFTHFL
jgi:hypothetical protein